MKAAIIIFVCIVGGNAISLKNLEETIDNYTKLARKKYNVEETFTDMEVDVNYEYAVVNMVFTDPKNRKNIAFVNEFDVSQFDGYCQQNGNETAQVFEREFSVINFKLTCQWTPMWIKFWRTAIIVSFILSYSGFMLAFAEIVTNRRNPEGPATKHQTKHQKRKRQ